MDALASCPDGSGAVPAAPGDLVLMPGERLLWTSRGSLPPRSRWRLTRSAALVLAVAVVAGIGAWILAEVVGWVLAFLRTGGDIAPLPTVKAEEPGGIGAIVFLAFVLVALPVGALCDWRQSLRDRREARVFVTDRRIGVLLPKGRLLCMANRTGVGISFEDSSDGSEIHVLPALGQDLPAEEAPKAREEGMLRLRGLAGQEAALRAVLGRHWAERSTLALPLVSDPVWSRYLRPGERLVWTGAPRRDFLLTRGGALAWLAGAGCALLLAALFWRLATGSFVGGDDLAAAVAVLLSVFAFGFVAHLLTVRARRRTLYALTDRAALIRERGTWKSPERIPLAADMRIDLTPGPAGSVLFATESRKGEEAWTHQRVGFRDLAEPEEPWRVLLALREALS